MLNGMRAALKNEEGYVDRFELVRRSMKLLAGLGAHPEVDETGPKEAMAAIAMASGLLQWLTARGGLKQLIRTNPIQLHANGCSVVAEM